MKNFDCLEMNKGLKKNCKAKRETKRRRKSNQRRPINRLNRRSKIKSRNPERGRMEKAAEDRQSQNNTCIWEFTFQSFVLINKLWTDNQRFHLVLFLKWPIPCSVTKFGEISQLYKEVKKLWRFCEESFSILQNFETRELMNFWMYWANYFFCKWTHR